MEIPLSVMDYEDFSPRDSIANDLVNDLGRHPRQDSVIGPNNDVKDGIEEADFLINRT